MKIKSRFSRETSIAIGFLLFLILMVLIRKEYLPRTTMLISAVYFTWVAVRKNTNSVAVNKEGIEIIRYSFFAKQTLNRSLENLSLKMDYLGATGKQRDAVLTVFEGATCFYQVFANEGFTVDQFKELIDAFNDLKAGRHRS